MQTTFVLQATSRPDLALNCCMQAVRNHWGTGVDWCQAHNYGWEVIVLCKQTLVNQGVGGIHIT